MSLNQKKVSRVRKVNKLKVSIVRKVNKLVKTWFISLIGACRLYNLISKGNVFDNEILDLYNLFCGG